MNNFKLPKLKNRDQNPLFWAWGKGLFKYQHYWNDENKWTGWMWVHRKGKTKLIPDYLYNN